MYLSFVKNAPKNDIAAFGHLLLYLIFKSLLSPELGTDHRKLT
jgi:hypothetical protein